MSEIIKNCTNNSNDILLWLKKDNEGYFIERRINCQTAKSDIFRIAHWYGSNIAVMSAEDAWQEMENHVMRRMVG